MFAVVYWLAAGLSWILRLSPSYSADLLIAAPKVAQAVFAALGDYYTWKLGEQVYGLGSNEAWAAVRSASQYLIPESDFYSLRSQFAIHGNGSALHEHFPIASKPH